MVAPVVDFSFANGSGSTGSSAYTVAYTPGFSSVGELLLLSICYQQPNGTANSVTSITDSLGLVWTRYGGVNYVGAADGNGLSGPSYTAIEVWYAIGNIPATASSVTVHTAAAVDHMNVAGLLISGFFATGPFDTNASLPGNFSHTTPAATPTLNITTNTADVLAIAIATTASNQFQSVATWNGVSGGSNLVQTNFSGGGSFFNGNTTSWKGFTAIQSGLVVNYVSLTNQLMMTLVVTNDVGPPPVFTYGQSRVIA